MGFSLLPKEVKFFDMYDAQAQHLRKAAVFFKEIAEKGACSDIDVLKMHDIEHECDNTTHDIINGLNRSFITPFDREDILQLAQELDDVVDIIYSLTKRMHVYKIKEKNKALVQFAEYIDQATIWLGKALSGLRSMKNSKITHEACMEVNRLENMADQLKDAVIGEYMEKSKDAIKLIKWKEIFEGAETTLDICEDVVNVISSILVKQG
ncbi:MAG: DUF47 family protein [Spirochaetes bacterium]|nr:DUF47 family protein [Spirochaetota bacterium]